MLFKIIRNYFDDRKIKRLLKRRLRNKMSDLEKINLNEGQYLIDGCVYKDTEIVNILTKWTVDNFIFRGNDVYLPHIPQPPMDILSVVQKHPDLLVNNFKEKFNNQSLSYLIYNIFIVGYESGREVQKNEQIEFVQKSIEEYLENLPKETISDVFSNEMPSETVDRAFKYPKKEDKKIKVDDSEELKDESSDEIEIDEIPYENYKKKELELEKNNMKVKPSVLVKGDDGEFIEEKSSITFYSDNKLVVDSERYQDGTYQKFISTIIENKLKKFGMDINDIYSDGFPSYIIGEIINEIEGQDAINNDQEKIKNEFYSYFKDIQKSITRDNTTTNVSQI